MPVYQLLADHLVAHGVGDYLPGIHRMAAVGRGVGGRVGGCQGLLAPVADRSPEQAGGCLKKLNYFYLLKFVQVMR